MIGFIELHPILTAVGAIVTAFIARFFAKGYAIRRRFHKLPGPPHSMIWGHLPAIGEAMKDLPPRLHPNAMPLRLQEIYNLPSYMYLDLWPVADTMLAVFDPNIMQQVTIDHPLPKHQGMTDFLIHVAGPGDLVSSNGAHWKKWRSIMNPGFAAGHLMTLVPGIVDHGILFLDKLHEHAERGDVFRLEEAATRLTVDVIGEVVLEIQLGTQSGDNEMVTALREQVHLLPNEGGAAPLKMWWPSGIYRRWRNTRIMNSFIGKILDERLKKQDSTTNSITGQKRQRKRSVIDLALEAYRAQDTHNDQGQKRGSDEEFKKAAITQIKTFILAGHDTTSTTICYALYMLQKYPACLLKIREEHDLVLGSVGTTAQTIKEDPHVLNKLEYTTAVIRETLRLWLPASGTRAGEPGFMARDPETGEPLPTEDLLIWFAGISLHRNPKVWGEQAAVFDPSRFMPENIAKLPENAWRPFEKGPRNCIGQDLAMLEARIILALVVRTFDFKLAYDSLDALSNDGSFYAKDDSFRKGRQDWDGEEAYPILIFTTKPREGMPVRVRKALQPDRGG